METESLLETFCTAIGSSGDESAAAEMAAGILSEFGETHIDRLGNVICMVSPIKNGRMVMLDAHIDQISLSVSHIAENGFVCAFPVGGIDERSIMGTMVKAIGRKGTYIGIVVSSSAVYTESGNRIPPKRSEIYCDFGYTKEEAEKLLMPGDRIMMCGRYSRIGNGYVTSPALDDRSGCVSIIEALKILKGKDLPCGVTACFSTREETGGEGAASAANGILPTEALEMDVSFAKTPDTNEIETKYIKKGPMIGFAPVLDLKMSRVLVEISEKEKIPFQYEVMGGSTGTNADEIVSAGLGVRTVTVSIPQQYMHSIIEKVSVEDVRNTGRLIAAYIMEGEC